MRLFLLLALTLTTVAVFAAAPPQPAAKEKGPPSERIIAEWVQQLADTSFRVRGAAQRSLIDAGPYAMPAVWDASRTSKDAEVKRRATEVAKELEDRAAKRFKELGAEITRRGDGSVSDVNYHNAKNPQLTDSDLVHLLALPRLESLCLRGTNATDEGMKFVGTRCQLIDLSLRQTGVTDAGLVHLKGLKRVESLDLSVTKVTGSGLANLKTLLSLKSLNLWNCRIGDSGLQRGVAGLKDLKDLTVICLGVTDITDEGLAHLASVKALTSIRLDETRVTGSGFKHLKALPNLQGLTLTSSRLTDEGCGQLAELKGVGGVLLDHTGVTIKGLKKLAAMPRLKVISLAGIKLTEAEEAELPKVLPNVVLDGFAEIIRP